MSEVVEKQREALVATIKDAESKEKQRIKRLAYVKNPNEQKALLVRFDKERNMDRQRIEQLTNDLFTLKKCSEEGQLSDFVEQRNIFKQSMRSTGQLMNDSAPNRFSGLEDYDSQLFHTDIVKKFDKYDAKFQSKQNVVPYNPREEVRKMRLLQEKRDLLQQLIAVETRATGCTGNTARRYSDNHSVFSNSSGVSSLTYATFATNSQQSQRPAPTATKKVFVPKLNIS